MKDELRECECGKKHPWGVIRKSKDEVPLYGGKPIPTCKNFRPKPETLPANTNAQELWAQTADLDPQASTFTRAVVARIRSLKPKRGQSALDAQWPEFMGFVISQITDMRGALVRDESKFSHLVAHTDEIVEAMRGVTKLSERLQMQRTVLNEMRDRMEEIERHLRIASAEEGLTYGPSDDPIEMNDDADEDDAEQ